MQTLIDLFYSALGCGRVEVKFVKRYAAAKRAPSGKTLIYRYEIYQAPTAQAARSFLDSRTVTANYTYLTVLTPEGNWGKDVYSLYKEE